MDLSTHSLSAECKMFGIQFFMRVGKISLSVFSALPPNIHYSTHYLNSFRGKPAIYEFGWPFTPYHKSSKDFSTSTCRSSGKCYPAFNLLMVSSFVFGSNSYNLRPFKTCFATPTPYGLSLLDKLSH